MNDRHDPDPTFLAYLEWQTRTELRRRARFGEPAPARRSDALLQVVRAAALALLCAIVGGGAVLASQELAGRGEREALEQRAELRIRTAERKLAALEPRLELLELRIEAGVASRAELAPLELARVELARELALAKLGAREIAASGRAVDDALDAALVGGEDFVLARLEERARAAEAVHRVHAETLARHRALVAAGRAPAGPSVYATQETETRELLRLLVDRIRLRLTYRQDGLTAKECRTADELLQELLLIGR